ncbi:putative transcriptional regulator tpeD isoform X1 [Wolffia australiana]
MWQHFAQADVHFPTAKAAKSISRKIFLAVKENLADSFVNVDQVSLTVDAWTVENDCTLMGITVHWVDMSWNLCKRFLAVRELVDKDNAESMADVILHVLKEFELESKVLAVTSDNASTNKKMMTILAEKLKDINMRFTADGHVPCVVHILNLVVQAGFKHLHITQPFLTNNPEEDSREVKVNEDISPQHANTTSLGNVVARVRRLVTAVHRLSQELEQDVKRIPLDCPTKWISTFGMLKAATAKREVLSKAAVAFLASTGENFGVADDEWDMLEEFIHVLGPFSVAIPHVCKSKTPVSEVIALVNGLMKHLEDEEKRRSSQSMQQCCGATNPSPRQVF